MPEVIKSNRQVKSHKVVFIPDESPFPEAEKEEEGPNPGQNEDALSPQGSPGEKPPLPARDKKAEAEALARKILENAKAEHDRIIKLARDTAAGIRQEARDQGYRDAKKEASQRAEECITEVYDTLEALTALQRDYFKQYERELKTLSLEIAEKILHKTLLTGGGEMEELIRHAVSSVKAADWITVEVSDKLVLMTNQLKKEFAENYRYKKIEFVPKNIPVGNVVVKTSEGAVDASVPRQIENLREIFKKMDDADK